MPSLYGTTGSTSNVAVTSTTGLYQMTSNTIVLTSAQQLLALLDNNGNVNFALDPANNYNTIYSYFTGNAGGGSGGGTLTLVGDVVAVGTVGSPITTYITASGVTAGTYGNASSIPIITVNSQGRITSANTVDIGTLTSLYSNANVASYLPVYGGNITAANVTAAYFIGDGSKLTGIVATSSYGNSNVAAFLKNFGTNSISTTGNVTATYFIGDGSKLTNITANNAYGNTQVAAFLPTYTGILTAATILTNNYLYANGQPFLGGYGNTQVAAYLASGNVTSNISTTANVGAGSVLTNNLLYANGQPYIFGSTYGNTQVAAYLASNTDPTISNLNANTQQQQTQINLINSTVQTLSANVGAFETYANATFVTSGAAYSNVNAGAYLSSNTVSTIRTTGDITATGNVTAGNIITQQSAVYNTTTTPAYSKGTVWYDTASDALAYYNGVANNTVHIGQETQFQAYNGTGSTITQGTPVYITGGATGSLPNIAPAQANTLTTAIVAGVANQNITAASAGYVVTEGTVANVSMGSYSTGDTLYLSPYSAGILQKTVPPTGYTTIVGVVTYSNSPNGRFLVRITNPTNNQTFGNITVTGNITTGNISSTNGYFWANGATYASTVTGTYGNTQVAAYLNDANQTPATAILINYANITNLQGGYINTNQYLKSTSPDNTNLSAALPAQLTLAAINAPFGGIAAGGTLKVLGAANIANISVTDSRIDFGANVTGIYWANGVNYLSGVTSTYGNANVAAYLPTYTGNISAGNILTNNYLFGNGVNILSTIAGTYSNTNVAAYLTTATINTTGNITGANLIATTNVIAGSVLTNNYLFANGVNILTTTGANYSNVNVAAYLSSPVSNLTIGDSNSGNVAFGGSLYLSGTTTIGNFLRVQAVYTGTQTDNTNLNVTAPGSLNGSMTTQGGVGIAKDLRVLGSANIAGTVTVGNISSTNGFFWAGNGAAYSTAGAGSPGGATNSIQYNNAGAFAGSGLNYFSANNTVITYGNVYHGNLVMGNITTTGFAAPNITYSANISLLNVLPLSGNANASIGVASMGNTASVTGTATNFYSNAIVGSVMQNYIHYHANQGNIAVGASAVNQYGFMANATMAATNNYGFWGGIAASAATRWNFYASGTAPNYMAGQLAVGQTGLGFGTFSVAPTTTTNQNQAHIGGNITFNAYQPQALFSNTALYGGALTINSYGANIAPTFLLPATATVSSITGIQAMPHFISNTVPTNMVGFNSNINFMPNNLAYATAGNISNVTSYQAQGITFTTGVGSVVNRANVNNYYGFTSANVSGTANNRVGNIYSFFGQQNAVTGPVTAYNLYMSGTAPNYLAGNLILAANIQPASSTGAVSVGTLTGQDTGIMASFQNNTNSYTYVAVQNTNSGTQATADIAFYNDQANLGVYMDVGINSSGYSGTGSLSLPNAGYVYTGNADLSIGTFYNNAIHFVTSSAATDAMTIYGNANIAVNSNLTNAGTTTSNRLITTQGVFWANGTAYSTGGGGGGTYVGNIAVIGGGGGGAGLGGSAIGGGGGAGGYQINSYTLTAGTTYTVTVGGGGAIGSGATASSGTSSIFGALLTSLGGGGGGYFGSAGAAGASGGGGPVTTSPPNYGAGTAGQGFRGGSGQNNGGGGGGGGSAVGVDATTGSTNDGGAGGAGTYNNLTGTTQAFAGGGGGGAYGAGPGVPGAGGVGGGATGGGVTAATTATVNSGGGGGGGGYNTSNQNPSAGASGTVIMSVPTASYSGNANVTGTYNYYINGSNTVIQWTASGSYVA
jgi:hypothetical protein